MERDSASFHGRDLFAPVAAKLARGGRGSPDRLARRPLRDRLC
ncbi:SAM-dependent chlorinase/fluorinase [Allomesorhizobium camelthorni]